MLHYSIGEIIDKLVIENIKIFRLREQVNNSDNQNEKIIELNDKMMTINDNRSILVKALNDTIEKVFKGEVQNTILRNVRTYGKTQ